MMMASQADEELPDDENYDEIEEGLFLGNLSAAVSLKTLKRLRISHIVTIESRPLPTAILSLPGMQFLFIQVDDMSHEDLLCHFPQIFDFITDGQKKGSVLVHCYFGVSRSACAVLSFLMKKYSISVDEAYRLAKSKRRFIGPNAGFMSQLSLYERLDYKLTTKKMSYKLYRLELAAKAFKRNQFYRDDFRDLFKTSTTDAASNYAKCKRCRQNIFSKDSVISHLPMQSRTWDDTRWDEEINQSEFCNRGILIVPLPWMEEAFRSPQGKLYCPKCQHKLGSFNWIQGCQCPCTSHFIPGFLIVPSKVDVNLRQ